VCAAKGGSAQARREEAAVIELTQEGLDQLRLELAAPRDRDRPGRPRRSGRRVPGSRFPRERAVRPKPNAVWAKSRARSTVLRGQIKAARVVAREMSDERVGLGSKVVLRDLEYNEELDYILVGPGEVDTRNRRISIQSPVGSALKDRTVGSVVEVDIPFRQGRATGSNGSNTPAS